MSPIVEIFMADEFSTLFLYKQTLVDDHLTQSHLGAGKSE